MKTQEQIEKLRTLQESFDNLAETYDKLANTSAIDIEAEVQQGKQQIAYAINYKGGEAEPTQAFTELAEDIKDIPNFDQWARLAGVLAGNSYNKNNLQGHNENVEAGNVTEIIDIFGTFTKLHDYTFLNWNLLQKVVFPSLTIIGKNCFSGSSIKVFIGENLINMGNQCFESSLLEYFYAPSMQNIVSTRPLNCKELKNVVVGKLESIINPFYNNVLQLRNITIGQDTNINLPFQSWTATDVVSEGQSGIDELNSNLYNNLLTKLADHSTDGQTRTLRLGWLAHVTQENIDYANSKGWTLTT
jgi:hypothetical protein